MDGIDAEFYALLRSRADAVFRDQGPGHTLQPTALVNEACLKLMTARDTPTEDREHMMAIGVRAMRQVLVDHARTKGARKRGGDRARVTLQDQLVQDAKEHEVDVLDLHEKLEALQAVHERPARVVEMRFFGGLTFEETGHVLGPLHAHSKGL